MFLTPFSAFFSIKSERVTADFRASPDCYKAVANIGSHGDFFTVFCESLVKKSLVLLGRRAENNPSTPPTDMPKRCPCFYPSADFHKERRVFATRSTTSMFGVVPFLHPQGRPCEYILPRIFQNRRQRSAGRRCKRSFYYNLLKKPDRLFSHKDQWQEV